MKASLVPPVLLSLLVLLASCGNEGHKSAYMMERSAPTAGNTTSDSSTVASPAAEDGMVMNGNMAINDPARKIIKTADFRCRVTDVLSATTHIERLTVAIGGQVSDSRLDNSTEESHTLPYKPDSLKQVESYTTTAHLTLKVPVTKLDTVLSDIAANAAFVNSRNLHLDDVTLRYLSNKLKNDAMSANDAAQRARSLARRSKDAVFSGEYTDGRNDTRIDRQIENMQLADQVSYATLTLDIYQPQRLTHTIVPNIEYLMKPTMGQQIGLALNNGWQLLRSFIIVLLQVWPFLLLLLFGVYILYRFRRSRRNGLRQAVVRA